MNVSAIFELPVHIWVMCDALDATYSTGYGELRFSVVMPEDRPPVGGPPPVPGVESHLLNPFKTWKDKAEFDKTARDLVSMFQKNFAKYENHVSGDIKAAAPEVRIAAE